MPLQVEPLQLDELDEYIKLYWAAFEPLEADMILPMIYPLGLQPDLLARLRNRILRETDGDPSAVCFCARDTTTHELVGVAWWDFFIAGATATPAQIEAEFEAADRARGAGEPIAGMNDELGQAFFRAAFFAESTTVEGAPYATLELLATGPAHSRRGVGSLLLRHGLEVVDRKGILCYVSAGICGRPLYEKFGFEVTKALSFDGRAWGGRSEGKHWSMLRPVKPQSESGVLANDI